MQEKRKKKQGTRKYCRVMQLLNSLPRTYIFCRRVTTAGLYTGVGKGATALQMPLLSIMSTLSQTPVSECIPPTANHDPLASAKPETEQHFVIERKGEISTFLSIYRVENPRGHLRALRLNLFPSCSSSSPRSLARRWYPKHGGNVRNNPMRSPPLRHFTL